MLDYTKNVHSLGQPVTTRFGPAQGARARRVLLLSPYFPPSTLAGVHRARHLAKFLPRAGWHPIVLCVDEARHTERLDPALAALVPADTEIVKTGALPASLTRLLGIGDISLRGWRALRRALFARLATRGVDAVMITGSPFYPMLLAAEIKRKYSVPVVLDFQDPWASDWGAMQSAFSKSGVVHRLATALEPRALRNADFVTSVSDIQNAELAARYSWLDRSRMAAIPIGCDPGDFAALRNSGSASDEVVLEPGVINLSYVGTFLPRAAPLMRALFRAFARLGAAEPELAQRIRLNFIGTSNQPTATSEYPVRALAAEAGVARSVREFPRRVSYLAALSVLARSSGVLLVGSTERHYTASKIYPALMCGRPFLSLFHSASSAHAILAAAGGGIALGFEREEALAALEPALATGLRKLAIASDELGLPDPRAYAPFEAGNIAARFGAIFDRLVVERAA